MNLLLTQIWALIRKNLLLLCIRRPISTLIRAFVLPLVIVLIIAYSKSFFSSPQHWGISSPHDVSVCLVNSPDSRVDSIQVRSLKDGLAASNARIVGFIDNGMKGDVANVIDSLGRQIREAGMTPKAFENVSSMAQECRTDAKGVSPCYGSIVFLSSPTQGTNESSQGVWNYTFRGSGAL